MDKTNNAFTLIEVIIVIGILLFVSIFTFPFVINTLQKGKLENILKDLSSRLFKYQQLAYSQSNNQSYGIEFDTNSFTLFIGDTLATSIDSTEIILPNNITISNINLDNSNSELVYLPGSFRPDTGGNIEFTDGVNFYNFIINKEGLIDYTKP